MPGTLTALAAPTLLLATTAANAADSGEHTATPLPALATGIGEMFLALLVVIALLLVTLWGIKRLTQPAAGSGQLRLLGSLAVGPRERVVLVAVSGQVLVLGVGGAGVRTLHVLPASEFGPADAATPVATTDFAAWLKKTMERRRDDRA